MQYLSSSTMRCSPRIWPSMRRSRFWTASFRSLYPGTDGSIPLHRMLAKPEEGLSIIPMGGIVDVMEQAGEHHGPHEHGEHGSHDGHHEHGGHIELFRRKFWISLLLTIPT